MIAPNVTPSSTSIRRSRRTRHVLAAVSAVMVPVIAVGVAGLVREAAGSTTAGLTLLAAALPVCALCSTLAWAPVLVAAEDSLRILGSPRIPYTNIEGVDVRLVAGKEHLCLKLKESADVPAVWRLRKRLGLRNLLDVSVGVTGLEVEPEAVVSLVYARVQLGAEAGETDGA